MHIFISSRSHIGLKRAPLAAVLALSAMMAAAGWAQTPAQPNAPANAPAKPSATRKATHARKPRAGKIAPAAKNASVVTPPPAPAQPEMPAWPANERPVRPAVTWDSKGLRIEATNSSLQQILKEVSTATGVQVEGLAADQRIYGTFGPAPAREVLSQLLNGTGYNIVMIGGQGQGAPRQILLSSKNAGAAPPALNHPNTVRPDTGEDDGDDDQPADTPPPDQSDSPRRQFTSAPQPNRGDTPHTPQQVLEELQQRQQQENTPPD